MKRAGAALKDYGAETARLIKERRARYAALYEEHRQLAKAQFDAGNAKEELARIVADQRFKELPGFSDEPRAHPAGCPSCPPRPPADGRLMRARAKQTHREADAGVA